MSRARVGVSGWSYKSWGASFYPPGLARAGQLAHIGRTFDSAEVNGSFYGLLSPAIYGRWYRETPPGFVFAVKGSRFITHNKKLRDVETPLANFFASGVLALEEKLGPFLWQLPARFRFDAERVAAFLELLPRSAVDAARLARRHDDRVAEPLARTASKRRLRHALEARHESFFSEEAVRLLRHAGVALVVSDSGSWGRVEEVTAGFVYVRLHGRPHTYASRYTDAQLDAEARKVRGWLGGTSPAGALRLTRRAPPRRKGFDVYVYFDNDAAGHAPHDALRLAARLRGAAVTPPRPSGPQRGGGASAGARPHRSMPAAR